MPINQIKHIAIILSTFIALAPAVTSSVAAPSVAVAPSKLAVPKDAEFKIPDGTIRKVKADHYTINKALLGAVYDDAKLLMSSCRIVPAIRNGKPAGFKLYAIREGSVIAALGMENGDTVEAINGVAITTAEGVLAVYAKMKDASEHKVQFVRKGKPLTILYTVQ